MRKLIVQKGYKINYFPKIILSEEKPTVSSRDMDQKLLLIYQKYHKKINKFFKFSLPYPCLNSKSDIALKIHGYYYVMFSFIEIYPLNMLVKDITLRQFKALMVISLAHEIGHWLDPDSVKSEQGAFEIEIILLSGLIDEWMDCIELKSV